MAAVPVRLIMSSIHMARRDSWEAQLKWAKDRGFWGDEVFGDDLVTGSLSDPFALDTLRETAQYGGPFVMEFPERYLP